MKNKLACIGCEVNHWDFDSEGNRYPIDYILHYKFNRSDVFAVVTVSELQNVSDSVKFEYIKTDDELLSNFKNLFLTNNFKDSIRKRCKKSWDSELDSINYDYLGFKT